MIEVSTKKHKMTLQAHMPSESYENKVARDLSAPKLNYDSSMLSARIEHHHLSKDKSAFSKEHYSGYAPLKQVRSEGKFHSVRSNERLRV